MVISPAKHSPGFARSAVLAGAAVLTALPFVTDAHARLAAAGPGNQPAPTDNAAQSSSDNAQLDIGSTFLQRLGRLATTGYAESDNSGGSGASRSSATPLYRGWAEAYGTTSTTGPQGDFVGDRRNTVGFVGGFGVTLAPGINLGLSIDQSRSKIDLPLATQSGAFDLTQFGAVLSYTRGAWTVAVAGVHGIANIDTTRTTAGGEALANYRGRVDGALAELSYAATFGQSRVVPKLAFEHVTARTDGFQEIGGLDPVTVAGASSSRTRILAGAEVGHYWIVGQSAIDVSAYGKFVDNVAQNIGAVQVTLNANSINVQGIRESQYGADAGASASYILTNYVRIYANYDGKFRDGFRSHQGTAGVELKW